MKLNPAFATSYPNGCAQLVYLTSYSGIVYAMPGSQFCDRATELAWAKQAAARGLGTQYIKGAIADYGSEATLALLRRRREDKRNPAPVPMPFLDKLRAAPLTPASFKYDRAVGVEIECFGPSLGDKLPVWVREGTDGSLSPTPGWQGDYRVGREYRILVRRSELEFRLHRVSELLAGHKVNSSCGLHIHLDCRGKTQTEVNTVARRMSYWLRALQELVPASRRNNRYCDLGFSTRSRYHAVNVCSFRQHGTIEVRLHSATASYEKILAWIRLCELLLVVKSWPRGATCLENLASLPLPEYERDYWLRRHAELNPTAAASTAAA